MAESSKFSRSVLGGSDEDYSRSELSGSDKDNSRSVCSGNYMNYSRSVVSGSDMDYSRTVRVGSGVDYSRSVLGGSDMDYSRTVSGGSDMDYSRSVLGGSDMDYSRTVRVGSGVDYSRSVLGGSDMDYSRTVSGGSDMDYSRSVLGGSDMDYSRTVRVGSGVDYSRFVLGGSDMDYNRTVSAGSDMDYTRSVLGGSDMDYSRSVLGGSDMDYSRSVLGGSDVGSSKTIFSDLDHMKETPCEPCQNEGKNTPAVKHCTDCSEYMCTPCSRNHMNFKAFRNHVIKDVEAVKPVINQDSTKKTDTSTNKLARLNIKAHTRSGNVISSSRTIRNVTANLVSTANVRTSNDNDTPNIWDLTVVQTHYCVVTDKNNKSVKVVDTKTKCVTSQIQLSDAECGWSITSVNDDQVAVSVIIKGVSKILLFSVSASGIISDTHKSIDVKLFYNCITYSNDRFYAAIGDRIDVISMQGQIITTFSNKSFSGLCDIAVSNDHNTIYVCSSDNDTVFSVDLNGNVTASYKDKDLKYLRGITVDSDGYLYVCSYTDCVHQLTADVSKIQVIIKDVFVWRCTFNRNHNSLNLGFGNQINVYNLTY